MTEVEIRGTMTILTEDLLDNVVHHLIVFPFKNSIIILDDLMAFLPETQEDVIIHEMLEEYDIRYK